MGAKLKGRAREFAKLEEKPKTDFDPEADNAPSDNDSQDDSEEENAGTEHYVQVGKSKLRKNEGLTLGPNYRGTRVSRKALEEATTNEPESASDDEDEDDDDDDDEDNDDEDEEFDDPETADLAKDQKRITDDELIESDEAFGESDEEFVSKFTFRGSSKPNLAMTRKNRPKASDFMDEGEDEEEEEEEEEEKKPAKASKMVIDDERSEESEEGDDDDEEDSDDDDEEGFEDLEDEDDEEDEDDDEDDEEDSGSDDDDQDETTNRNFNPTDHLSALSAAAKQEVLKGMAVRDQRKLFDGLLNFRIRLQKALVAANSLSLAQEDADESDNTDDADYDAAEQAALQLWSTLENIRGHLTSSMVKGSQKRKYEVDSTTATPTIWGYMQADEADALKHRRITLDKWSRRVGPSAATSRNQLKATSNSICAVLDEQLAEPARLIKRTQVPRSCAPVHTARKIGEDAGIYDDADFYQLLLKELVEQRSAENDQAAGEAVATVRWAAMKEAKTRKVVDRKASRGRKLKFTVHEKLQSFMAPEDRRQWEEEAIDRLFSTLLGQQVALDEEDQKDEDEDEDEDMDAEEEGLMLFRN